MNSPAVALFGLQGTLLADRRWWTIATASQQHPAQQQQPPTQQPSHTSSASGSTPAAAAAAESVSELVPCVSAALRGTEVCLQIMQQTNDMHLNIFASDTEWLDVRVGRGCSTDSARNSRSRSDSGVAEEAVWQDPSVVRQGAARAAPDAGQAVGLGRIRWASCGDELASRRSAAAHGRPPGHSIDAELPSEAAVRRLSTATNPPAGPGMFPASAQRLTVGGMLYEAEEHSLAPAAATTAAAPLGVDGETVAADVDKQAQPGAASKAVSRDGASTEADGGEQQLGAFDLFPPLLQPAADSDKGPEIAVIKILDELPADESAHLSCKGKRAGCKAAAAASAGVRGGSAGPPVAGSVSSAAAFKFYFGYCAEGTMAIEVRFRELQQGHLSIC